MVRMYSKLTTYTFVWLLCVALLSHSAFATTLSSDTRLQQANALLQQLRYADALEVYFDLLREYPEDDTVNLLVARTARLAGKHTASLMAYERLLANNPHNAQWQQEAQSLLSPPQPAPAARLVVKANQVAPAYTGAYVPVNNSAEALAQLPTFFASGRVTTGAVYDSNQAAAPTGRNVRLGSIPISLDAASTQKEAFGAYVQGFTELGWRAYNTSPFWVVADATGYHKWSHNKALRRDISYGKTSLGVQYQTPKWQIDTRAKMETVLLNNDTTVNISGAQSELVVAISPQTQLLGKINMEYREDLDTPKRSGTYWAAGPYMRWFTPDATISFTLGAKAYGGQALDKRYSMLGVEPTAMAMALSPWGTYFIGSISWRNEQYEGPATYFDQSKRVDQQVRTGLFALHPITESISVECGWQYTDNISNSDLYTYDQHLITVGITYAF